MKDVLGFSACLMLVALFIVVGSISSLSIRSASSPAPILVISGTSYTDLDVDTLYIDLARLWVVISIKNSLY